MITSKRAPRLYQHYINDINTIQWYQHYINDINTTSERHKTKSRWPKKITKRDKTRHRWQLCERKTCV